MSLNASTLALPRDLRRAVRAKLTSMSGWDAYRATLGGLTAADLDRRGIIAACDALGVDIANIAAHLGTTLATANPNAPVNTLSPSGASPVSPATVTPFPHVPASPASPVAAPSPVAGEGAGTFEGRAPDDIVRDALASAADLLGSKVLATLTASFLPVAAAASQGPRTIVETKLDTRTVTVTVDAEGRPVAAPVTPVTALGTREARDVFSGMKTRARTGNLVAAGALPIPVYDGTPGDGDVPAWDALYSWNPEVLSYLCLVAHLANSHDAAKRKRASLLLYGPAGTGKTSAAECFAGACGRPFYRVAIDRTTEPLELVGQRLPAATGGTVFHEGALVMAMQIPGAVILIDEPSFLRPGSAAVLQTIMDKRYVYLKEDGNRRIDAAPGVMFLAADNTNLTGDETGRYADTNTQNLALQDRFAYSVRCDYMSPATEAQTLSAHTGLALAACEKMVSFATLTRQGASNGQLTTGASYRRLLAWADAVSLGIASKDAFRTALVNPTDAADRETFKSLEKNNVQHPEIDALATGVVASAPVHGNVVSAQGARAADAFPDADDVA